MASENPIPSIHKDPPPLSIGPQKVTLLEEGGWKATIECPKAESECNSDYQFSGPGGGINLRRRFDLLKRIGVS